MKNLAVVLALVACAALIAGCKGGTNEMQTVLDDISRVNGDFLASLEKVQSAPDFAKALKVHSMDVDLLRPKMAQLVQRYPELASDVKIPPELEAPMRKNREMDEKIGNTISLLLGKYGEDPEVREAFGELFKILEGA
jgi:predicted small secreted protein